MENKNRDEARAMVVDIFSKGIPELSKEQIDDLEVGIFNASLDYANDNGIVLNWDNTHFRDVYANKARGVYSNMSKSYVGNGVLLKRVLDGELLPHDVAYLRSEEMFPEKWKEIMDITRDKFRNAYEMNNTVAMTNRFVCKRCKSRMITYYDQMTRSADEAITTFYECQACNHRWKN